MTTAAALARVERRYDVLTADERFRLWALAEARGDDADVRRLIDACPKFAYTMNDLAFSDRARGLTHIFFHALFVLNGAEKARHWGREIVPVLARDLGRRAGELVNLAWRGGFEAGALAAGRRDIEVPAELARVDFGDRAAPDWLGETWAELLGQEAGGLAPDFVAFIHAFNAWGLDVTGAGGLALLAGYSGGDPFTMRLVEFAGLALETEPDAAELAEARAALDDLWARLVPGV